MDTTIIATILTLTTMTAIYWGVKLSIVLPEFDSRFDRKPFNCRPCLTFHLSWVLSTIVSMVTGSMCLFVSGIGMAFIVFATIWYFDNKKIEK